MARLTLNFSATKILNNAEWFGAMSVLDFFGPNGCARDMRVSAMIGRDSVQNRMSSSSSSDRESEEGGISLSEFCYQAFQGYDFLHLYREEGVKLQIGGSDQWGNIVSGTSLIRKSLQRVQPDVTPGVQGLTMPLLTDAHGQKMGKTSGGQAVWLDPERVSPFQFYQFWYAYTCGLCLYHVYGLVLRVYP